MLQGLQNLGNTCYINTLLQCIGHCGHLRTWLLTEKGLLTGDNHPLTTELARVTHEMWGENKSLAPFRFLKTLFVCLQGFLSHGEQMDISELWMLLVDKINTEIGVKHHNPDITGGSDTEGFLKAWRGHNRDGMSHWLMQVQGWTLTRIQCSRCQKTAMLYEPFCCLGLDMLSGVESKDMAEMFANMFKKESIQERECDYCHQRAPATKSTSICMYPNVLVCCFKRFEMTPQGRAKKRNDAIHVPLSIKLNHSDQVYHLASIANHVGSLDGGHYFATAKNPDGKWHMYDDISITPKEDTSKFTQNNRDAYMLFYELGVA